MEIFASRSVDDDNSETLSVSIIVPSDVMGVIGDLAATSSVPTVRFTSEGGGICSVTAMGSDALSCEAAIGVFLEASIIFTPRLQLSLVFTGENGIIVEAISSEIAAGDGIDTKVQTMVTYVDVTVMPVIDLPVLANAETVVAPSSSDFVLGIGNRLGFEIADEDGS